MEHCWAQTPESRPSFEHAVGIISTVTRRSQNLNVFNEILTNKQVDPSNPVENYISGREQTANEAATNANPRPIHLSRNQTRHPKSRGIIYICYYMKQVRKEIRGNSHDALFSGCTVTT